MKKNRVKNNLSILLAVIGVLLLLYVVSMLVLFYWSFITSFKGAAKDFNIFDRNRGFGFPKEWKISNYVSVFNKMTVSINYGKKVGFWVILVNSLLYALGCAFLKTLIPCLTAYSCARFDFKSSKIVYGIVLITMIVPIVGSLPSELKIAYSLGLYNHIWGLWIMAANMQGLYFFVMYSAFKAMPLGYSEAAKIDGASNAQILLKIALPLIRNLFLTVLLINFVEYWNNYQSPKVYLPDYPTLGFTLFVKSKSNDLPEKQQLIALAFIVAAPVLALFVAFQNRLMGNLTMGGLKG